MWLSCFPHGLHRSQMFPESFSLAFGQLSRTSHAFRVTSWLWDQRAGFKPPDQGKRGQPVWVPGSSMCRRWSQFPSRPNRRYLKSDFCSRHPRGPGGRYARRTLAKYRPVCQWEEGEGRPVQVISIHHLHHMISIMPSRVSPTVPGRRNVSSGTAGPWVRTSPQIRVSSPSTRSTPGTFWISTCVCVCVCVCVCARTRALSTHY